MKRAVAPCGKSLIFHRGVGPGWGSSGDGELGSWSVCGPHLELVFSDGMGGAAPDVGGTKLELEGLWIMFFPARARVLSGCAPAFAASNPRPAVDSYSALRPFG